MTMKFKPPSKRKKVDEAPPPSSSSTPALSPLEKRDVVMKLINRSTVHETPSSAYIKIQHARNFAVAQAQQDGCKGNYKVFDSSFGNYLVPVIPTRAELG